MVVDIGAGNRLAAATALQLFWLRVDRLFGLHGHPLSREFHAIFAVKDLNETITLYYSSIWRVVQRNT